MAKPALILVGADKGGVGKTTVARTLLDYFTAHHVPTRAFDTESPRGTLKRFHSDVADIVDATSVADQMRIIDTLSTTDSTVTVMDVRAGLLSPTLRSLRDIGFLDAVKKGQITFVVFHILGSSIASLNEIEETAPLTPFLTFVANKDPKGETDNYSFVLRGYVRHWLGNVWAEYDRVKLLDLFDTAVEATPAPARAQGAAGPK